MNLNSTDFGVSNTAELLSKIQSGESIKADRIGIIIRQHSEQDAIEVLILENLDGSEILVDQVPMNEEGLVTGLLEAFHELENHKFVEGFQVENEDGECYEHESHELMPLNDALALCHEAVKNDPEGGWYINVLRFGDVEDSSWLDSFHVNSDDVGHFFAAIAEGTLSSAKNAVSAGAELISDMIAS